MNSSRFESDGRVGTLPCGFTGERLPVGLQMVGGLRSEGPLLSYAAALEAELGLELGPIDPRESR